MYYYQLRAFHAVATYGGFSKAARQLNISQPAISDQVRKLEGWFNIRLFERKRRSVVPTELGLRLFELTRLERVFTILPDVDQALAARSEP